MLRVALLLVLLFPGLCLANYGRVLYVKGAVTVERGGKTYRAVKNAKLLEGDTINTGRIGRMHVRMADRTLLSLKPNTSFQIQTYRFTSERSGAQISESGSNQQKDRSVFRLLKGGFRAVTGFIGKRDRSAFGVSTSVATIGIRGTSFVVNLSGSESNPDIAQDVQGIQLAALDSLAGISVQDGTLSDADGLRLAQANGGGSFGQRLTVGVADGSVILTNTDGSLVLENGEFGEVLAGQAPVRLLVPPNDSESAPPVSGDDDESSTDDSTTETQVATRIVTPDTGTSTGGNSDQAPPNTSNRLDTEENEFPGTTDGALARRNVALSSAVAGEAQTLTLAENAQRLDNSGRVIGLVTTVQGSAAAVQLDDGSVSNAGFDPETQLRWGRWGGTVSAEFADGDLQRFSANEANLHLIQSLSGDAVPAVPTTGSQNFVLVGNTDPSNDAGAVGFLGSASLSANFDTQQVQSSLNLSVNQQLWQASGSGSIGATLGTGTPANSFAGDYQNVSIDGANTGSGNFTGFFTEGAQAAGLSYRLNGAGSAVNGVAAFAATAP